MACIDIPEFLFQWMVVQQPDWARQPMALVKDERPTALLQEVNGRAMEVGLRRGMRFGEALSQIPYLRARSLSPALKNQITLEMIEKLRAFSPQIEACPHNSGVFYLGLNGLEQLFPCFLEWRSQLLQSLESSGYQGQCVIGFSHFGSLAVARHDQPVLLLETPQQEDQLAQEVALWRLGVPVKLTNSLSMLGVTSLGDFLKLTSESLLERFGREAYDLHRRAKKVHWDPLQNVAEPTVWEATLGLDYAEPDRTRILHLCEKLLHGLLVQLSRQKRAVQRLHFAFQLQNGDLTRHSLGLSEPSLDQARLLDLLRLRLESTPLEEGVTDLELQLEEAESPPEQLELFDQTSRREVQAANRALDRVRAELGPGAVVRACLTEGHLPAASFRWEPLDKLRGRPTPPNISNKLLRRFQAVPQPLTAPKADQILDGPYRLSGGWWVREIERDYYYLLTPKGEIHWAFQDQRRGLWFQEGIVD
jgi:protein ImuB